MEKNNDKKNRDYLNLKDRFWINNIIDKNSEGILFSDYVIKYNERNGHKKKRIILLTTKNVYIIKERVAWYKTSRQIPIPKITGLVIDLKVNKLIIKISNEYDTLLEYTKIPEILLVWKQNFAFLVKNQKIDCKFWFLQGNTDLESYRNRKKTISKAKNPNWKPQKIDKNGFPVMLESFNQTIIENDDYHDEEEPQEVLHTFCKLKHCSEVIMIWSNAKHSNVVAHISDFKKIKQSVATGSFGKIYEYIYETQSYIGRKWELKEVKKFVRFSIDALKNMVIKHENCKFAVNLEWVFYDKFHQDFIFMQEFMKKGSLLNVLQRKTRFNEERTKFYAAQIILALRYFHINNIPYRNLVPENILIYNNGYICLTDFGIQRILKLGKHESKISFGNVEYVSPEVNKGGKQSMKDDWWSLGVLIYEMLVGITPFYDEDPKKILQFQQQYDVQFPDWIKISNEGKDFVQKLLQRKKSNRLGIKNGFYEISKHAWFENLSFEDLQNQKFDGSIFKV